METIIKDDHSGEEPMLVCPVCGFEYTHVKGAYTRLGNDKAEAGIYEGTQQKGVCDKWRRSGLVIEVEGECGHTWNIVLQQHKGNTFVIVENTTPALAL